MRILIVVATQFEIEFLLNYFSCQFDNDRNVYFFENEKMRVEILIAGIGIAFTIFNLSKLIFATPQKYNLVVNVGIAGSFNKQLALGQVVSIYEDQFADLAIEQANGDLQTIFETNFANANEFPFIDGKLKIEPSFSRVMLQIDEFKAITVNTTHGFEQNIQVFKKKYNADIESMEGAAVFYVCKKEKIKVLQVRSISNYVEIRNIKNWKTKEAIQNLNRFLINFLLS